MEPSTNAYRREQAELDKGFEHLRWEARVALSFVGDGIAAAFVEDASSRRTRFQECFVIGRHIAVILEGECKTEIDNPTDARVRADQSLFSRIWLYVASEIRIGPLHKSTHSHDSTHH
jgi:hypothetical protein